MAYIDKTKLLTDINNGIKAGNLEEGYEQYQNINNMDDIIETIEWADEADVVERSEYDKLEKRYKLCKRLAEQGNELRLKIDKAIEKLQHIKIYEHTSTARLVSLPEVLDVLKRNIGE